MKKALIAALALIFLPVAVLAHKTPLASCLAVIICLAAIILGGYLIVDGIRHPAIGSGCGWIYWHNKVGMVVTCGMDHICERKEWSDDARILQAQSGYDSKAECEAVAMDAEMRRIDEADRAKDETLKRGDTYYIKLAFFNTPQCWPVGHNPND